MEIAVAFMLFTIALLIAGYYVWTVPEQQASESLTVRLRGTMSNRLGIGGLLAAVMPEASAGAEILWGEECQRRQGLVVGVANLNGPARLDDDPRLFFGQDNVRHDLPPADSAYRLSPAAVNDRLTRQRDLLASQALFVCRCPASSSAMCREADFWNEAKNLSVGSAWAASCGEAKTPTSSNSREATESSPCRQTRPRA